MRTIKKIDETTFRHKHEEREINLYNTEYDGFVITLSDDTQIRMGIDNSSQCCEQWGYLISEDSIDEFIGATYFGTEVVGSKLDKLEVPDVFCGGVMFININTSEGVLQFVAYNDHNGYYSHDGVLIDNGSVIHREYL